jgi:Tfp pilus assembly protein PilF
LLLPGRHDFWTERVYASAFADSGDPVLTERFYEAQLEKDPSNAKDLNNLGVLRWRQGKDSEEYLLRALRSDSLNPVILYNLGVVNFRSDRRQAELYLLRAKERDRYSLRIKEAYNDTLRAVGARGSATVVDLVDLLGGLPENQYFMDHCHPTLAGHKLIAAKLLAEIAPLLSAGG